MRSGDTAMASGESRRIWKYKLRITDEQSIEMPTGAQFLSVQFQDGDLCMWALVDLDEPMHRHRFYVVGTGNPMPRGATYHIGTVQQPGLHLVWHVFE
jgi:hypothetical protein